MLHQGFEQKKIVELLFDLPIKSIEPTGLICVVVFQVQQRRRHYNADMHHGFEAEFDPEDIFNMFFGGFPGGTRVYTYTPGGVHRRHGFLTAAVDITCCKL